VNEEHYWTRVIEVGESRSVHIQEQAVLVLSVRACQGREVAALRASRTKLLRLEKVGIPNTHIMKNMLTEACRTI
tara:strand:+ start:1590 stop:1814 length:225 start_codon:yes stop_codon:yes gene_type:complete